MGRYDAIKVQRGKINESKLWFKDVQYIENVINLIKSNREIYFNYRMQISAMMFDLGECVKYLGGFKSMDNPSNRNMLEDKLSTLRTAVEKMVKEINANSNLNIGIE